MENTLTPTHDAAPAVVVGQALAKASTPQEALRVRDYAALREQYARQIRDADNEILRWQRIKLEAVRKLGELIPEQVRAGNPQLSHDATIRLEDLGISRSQSSRCQKIARIPQEQFDEYLGGDNPTQAGALKLAKTVKPAPEKPKDYVTLDAWRNMSDDDRQKALSVVGSKQFNEQASTSIDWARWSWNPVTGCLHGCAYCYARDAAKLHKFPQGFTPSLIPERLTAPQNKRVPKQAADDPSHRNVFTCSMADLFGKWVPCEWINAVLEQVREAPQWNFLFLTKFPQRLTEFAFPENAWVGTSVDRQSRVKQAESAFAKVDATVKWLSVEPLLEPLTFSRLDLFDWIAIGGASRSKQTPAWHPPRQWVMNLWDAAEKADCRVYEKDNLLDRRKEYPGAEVEPVPCRAPKAMFATSEA